MKITKKAKSVKVRYIEVKEISYIPEYQCPTCRTVYKGFGPARNVTRFICECGQELIVVGGKI